MVDGKRVGAGKVEATAMTIFSADDTCDVGADYGSPVSPEYGPRGNAFNGAVKGVEIDLAEAAEDADHYLDPQERVRIALARQ